MNHIRYNITDADGIEYKGSFVTNHKNHKTISGLIANKHPKIMLPFKSHDIKVKKV